VPWPVTDGNRSRAETTMPSDSTCDVLGGGRVVRILDWGRVGVGEATRTLTPVFSDPGMASRICLLVEARDSLGPLTMAEARTLADAQARLSNGRVRRTALLTSGGVQCGVGRMMRAYAECRGLEMEVFTDEMPALLWVEEGLLGEPPADGRKRQEALKSPHARGICPSSTAEARQGEAAGESAAQQ